MYKLLYEMHRLMQHLRPQYLETRNLMPDHTERLAVHY